MSDKRLFLLDGHALVYRAHFAFITRPLINSKGINTSAISGFTRTLVDLIRTENPTHLGVAFDPHGPTFRNDLYEPYKANREEQPDDIRIAFPWIRRILDAFKIPIVEVPGYEADDVIGTLAKKAEQAGYTVFMVTPDKDYAQLVSPNIFMYKPSRQGNGIEVLGEKEILANWQIQRVSQVIDVLGLMGDAVDNIPGIPGVGEKTAVQLIAQFDSVEGVVANVGQLKGKQKERVEQFAEQALLSKRLATIDLQVPIDFVEERWLIDPFDRETLAEIFRELEFRTLAQQILGEERASESAAKPGQQGVLFGEPEPPSAAKGPNLPSHAVAEFNITNTPHQYYLLSSRQDMEDFATLLSTQSSFCFDTETTNIDATQADLVGMSFSIKPGEAYYLPAVVEWGDPQHVVDIFQPVLENPNIVKIGQNLKYDLIVLKNYGVEVQGVLFDTMIAHYLLEPERRHNMDYLAETYLNYKPIAIEELLGKKGKSQLNMGDLTPEQVKDYAAEDADITLQLKNFLGPKLEETGVKELFESIEAPLVKVLAAVEFTGIRIDADYLAAYSSELENDILTIERKIYEQAGQPFNIGSPKQVGEVLFERLKLPYKGAKTKTGQYSTDEDKLQEMATEFPIVASILQFRGLSKLKSTYVDALPKMINPRTSRIHSSFNQALTATGRLSSNNPNLQNIPVRTPEGARVRQAFIPRDAQHVLLAADYSQIELRLIADLSNETAMLEAFAQGLDIHLATAAKVFGVPLEAVTREQRYQAKTVNFSIIYGAGATNLSRQLNIKRPAAKDLIDAYFREYPGLKRYMEQTVEEARKNGYVSTPLGRRRYLRDINSKSGLERSNAERMAVNSPIQGFAADLIKIAMVRIHEKLLQGGWQAKMVLQVHDELVFDVPLAEVEPLKPLIIETMSSVMPSLRVPIVVEVGQGQNWLEAH